MKNIALLCLLLLTSCRKQSQPVPAIPTPPVSELESVLEQMDVASATFTTAQTECAWVHCIHVVMETETKKGHLYMRRNGTDMDVLLDITWPSPQKVLFQSGKMSVYEPKIAQVSEYERVPREAPLSYLMVGFGGRGHDLLQSYNVSLAGWETVDEARTAKLQLIPLSHEFGSAVREFFVWIDPQRDVPIQWQVRETDGDRWIQHCTGFQINGTISDDVFVFKTTSRTKIVKGQTN